MNPDSYFDLPLTSCPRRLNSQVRGKSCYAGPLIRYPIVSLVLFICTIESFDVRSGDLYPQHVSDLISRRLLNIQN